jgi:hypothetical protein
MIVRVLGDGQFELDEALLATLEAHDHDMMAAIEHDESEAFERALAAGIELVRSKGRRLPPEHLEPSDLTLPHEGASLAEVKELLTAGDTGEAS